MGCTTTPVPIESGPGNNGNEGILQFTQSSWTGASPSDDLVLYPGYSFCRWSYS